LTAANPGTNEDLDLLRAIDLAPMEQGVPA
jgi:hypothetical protein